MEQEPGQEVESDSRKIADLVKEFGEVFGFDEETCEEIAAMPFEDSFETAYSYLTQAGLDPDEVLAPFIEEPKIIGGPH